MLRPRFWPCLAALLATTSCAEGSANFHLRYEPGFVPGPTTISLLGVFHEGRMNRETWAQIGPPLSALLGQRTCEVAYGDRLGNADPELYAAIDESVKSEGVTEELLTRLAPAAEGDLILVVSLTGHTTISSGIEDGSAPGGGRVPQPGSGSRMRNNRAPGGTQGRGAELPEIEISGTLFSARSHRRVARIHMAYSGSDLPEAIGKFVRRTGEMVPGSSCRGWRWRSAGNP
jgi:hypothetical protein